MLRIIIKFSIGVGMLMLVWGELKKYVGSKDYNAVKKNLKEVVDSIEKD